MKKNKRFILLGFILLIIITIVISLLSGSISSFDSFFYNKLILIQSNFFDTYFKLITVLANTETIIVFCFLSLLTLFFNKKDSLLLVGTVILSTIINLSLKHIFLRPRPDDINLIVETGYSFPSGHSMASVSFYGFIIYLVLNSNWKVKYKWISNILLTVLIISICLSRVYLGVHYASDVTCGALISTSLLLVITYIIDKKRGIIK